MKRLEVPQSSYTDVDAYIWLTVCPGIPHLLTWSRVTDTRDAQLMFDVQRSPYGELCAGPVWAQQAGGECIAVRGEPLGRARWRS